MTCEVIEDQTLKAKHRAMWASGHYDAVATEVIAPLGEVLVAAAGVRAGDGVLDLAAGSGNAAFPAARLGAKVIATDITTELMEIGERRALAEGLSIKWVECDAEAMPCRDGQHDTVLSCVGVMFAPHHQAAADEIVRITRPGGTIALVNWTPKGLVGQMFATMRPFAPVPPPGAQPAPLWGEPEHLAELFGDRVHDVRTEVRQLRVTLFATAEEFRDYFKANYGPTIAVYNAIADDPARAAALDQALVDLAHRFDSGEGSFEMDWEYLVYTATR